MRMRFDDSYLEFGQPKTAINFHLNCNADNLAELKLRWLATTVPFFTIQQKRNKIFRMARTEMAEESISNGLNPIANIRTSRDRMK